MKIIENYVNRKGLRLRHQLYVGIPLPFAGNYLSILKLHVVNTDEHRWAGWCGRSCFIGIIQCSLDISEICPRCLSHNMLPNPHTHTHINIPSECHVLSTPRWWWWNAACHELMKNLRTQPNSLIELMRAWTMRQTFNWVLGRPTDNSRRTFEYRDAISMIANGANAIKAAAAL